MVDCAAAGARVLVSLGYPLHNRDQLGLVDPQHRGNSMACRRPGTSPSPSAVVSVGSMVCVSLGSQPELEDAGSRKGLHRDHHP
jgi:hypothetical protein